VSSGYRIRRTCKRIGSEETPTPTTFVTDNDKLNILKSICFDFAMVSPLTVQRLRGSVNVARKPGVLRGTFLAAMP
jgi:hypothetical protein